MLKFWGILLVVGTAALAGFGASTKAKKQRTSAAVLLQRSEKRYEQLERAHSEEAPLREFVIALRCSDASPVGRQLCDWVPFCSLGLVSRASNECVPWAIKELRREIVEGARSVLGGAAAKQLASSRVAFSYELMDDFRRRVIDTLERDRREAIDAARGTLALDDAVSLDDAVAVKAAYRRRCREAHPDVAGAEGLVSIDEIKAAYDLLTEDATYASLGGRRAARTFFGPVDLDAPAPDDLRLDAAVTRLDPDLISPFLYRNVRRASAPA